MIEVHERSVRANGLVHHVVEWCPDAPSDTESQRDTDSQHDTDSQRDTDAPRETVLLAHGFLDLAWSWRWLAERLAARGYRCIAWDWRGHGETEHVGTGGYYHFPDYVLDLDELLPQLSDSPVHLVGHSMGGTVSTMYAALRKERLLTLTLVEGIGPPSWPFERTPEKFLAWLDGMAKLRGKDDKPMPDLEAAVARMRVQNPKLSDEAGLFLAEKGTRPTDEGRVWRFDRRHRTTAPMPFRTEMFSSFLAQIAAPTLYVAGEKGFRLPDEDERLALVPTSVTKVELPGAGHMLHREEPDALADAWLAFVDRAAP